MKFIDRDLVRFVIAGGLNAVFGYSVYLLLLLLAPYAISYTVAYAAGILFAYCVSARFVFRRPLQWRHAAQYPLVYALQYLLGITLTVALVERAHVNPEFVLALVIVITLPVTFWLSRWIIKRDNKTDSTSVPR
jgi:putative flippase GtrA